MGSENRGVPRFPRRTSPKETYCDCLVFRENAGGDSWVKQKER